jgi:hypothetical protein
MNQIIFCTQGTADQPDGKAVANTVRGGSSNTVLIEEKYLKWSSVVKLRKIKKNALAWSSRNFFLLQFFW